MSQKPTYEELEQRVKDLEREFEKRNRAEEALQETEEKYRKLVEESFDGIFIQKGPRIIFANKRLNEMLGYGEDELIGRNHWELYHPDYQKLTRERAQVRMRGGEAVPRYEVKLQRKDGSWFYGEVNARAVTFPPDGESGIQVWVKDITESKRAEQELKESKEKYRAVLDSNPDPVVVYDMEGKVIYLNFAFTRIFGWSLEEMKGKKLDQFVPEENWPETRMMINKVTVLGENFSGLETRRYTRDGNVLNIGISGSCYRDRDGKVAASVINLRDITEQKKLEAQLLQAQKMEAIGALAGGIAHDFNNLLMAIQGRASMMLMGKDSSHSDFGHLKGIEDYVGNAADLTKQLLGFARGGKYEVKPTDVNELVRKEGRMFGRTKKEIVIREKLEDHLWPVMVDRGQIQQVLLNLYVNAWQAMPGGGVLYLETANMTFDAIDVKPFSVEPGRYVKISVADTGTGMDRATQERIFDPFFTTKEMGRGTGLGLASAYGIIKNHGGFINVYSEKGQGSTFNIYLPASERGVVEDKEPDGNLLKGIETVLFVDDETMVTEVAKSLLELMGYKTFIAESGEKAVKIYEENRDQIDIVVLDMIMPDMSGSETYDSLKRINPTVKVLLSSGYSVNGQATRILDRGCNGFIQKPFKIKELSQKLREILDEGQPN